MTGILLIDKEPDWTSHDVIAKLRGVLKERRMGHAGTLDPMATGLLVVLCGRATRAATFAEANEKEYVAALRLGISTDTQDITGRVLSESALRPTAEEVAAVLPRFTGEILQLPPMYSAIKIKGQKLYDIARRGGDVEREARPITIHQLEFMGEEGGDFLLRVRCSKGTYIRTLCHDIGAALGCGGTMASLRRVRCGVFSVADACTVGEADAARVLPLDSLFSDREAVTLSHRAERFCRCGNDFALDVPDGEYRLFAGNGEFLALGRAEKGRGRAIKSFFEVNG
ncbi:MAG: tRNA pseudouridine(55) synthase TruB [Oscillospiraceae bacterium]|nr:tRNA pseudouridine(55) synthase TruB [Oscillospiraceae bacterium]